MNAFLKLKVGPVEIKKNGRVVGKRKKRNNLNGEKKKKISDAQKGRKLTENHK